MENETIKEVEALLFASGRYMDEEHIGRILGIGAKEARNALKELKEIYDKRESAIKIVQEDKSWKMNVRDKYVDIVQKIVSDTELSKTVLETLAVIAWKNPILQSEVIKIRTNKAYEHIKELVELGFVTKEPCGKSFKLRLTEKFYNYFDVVGKEEVKKLFEKVDEKYKKEEIERELEEKRKEKKSEGEENESGKDGREIEEGREEKEKSESHEGEKEKGKEAMIEKLEEEGIEVYEEKGEGAGSEGGEGEKKEVDEKTPSELNGMPVVEIKESEEIDFGERKEKVDFGEKPKEGEKLSDVVKKELEEETEKKKSEE